MHSSKANTSRGTTGLSTWEDGVSRHSNTKQLVTLVGFVPSPMNGRLLYTIPQNSHWTENESWRMVSSLNEKKKLTNGSWRITIPNTQTEGMDIQGKHKIWKEVMSLCVFCPFLQINLGFGWFYFVQKEGCTRIDHVATLLLPKPGQFKV